MNQAFSKIWIIVISLVLIAGGIFAWQYSEASWKTYQNEEFGFQIKHPKSLILESKGSNLEQQKLEKGEAISGTVQPSYDTIVFFEQEDKEQFKIEVFHPYEKEISKKNYTDDYLYL